MTIFLKNPNQIENSTRISNQKVIRSLSLIAFTVRQRVEDAIGWKKYSIVGIQICVITSRIRRESISRRGIGTLGADNINELNFNRRSWGAEIYSNGIPAVENRFVHSFIYGWKEKHRDPLLRLIVTLFSSFALRDEISSIRTIVVISVDLLLRSIRCVSRRPFVLEATSVELLRELW